MGPPARCPARPAMLRRLPRRLPAVARRLSTSPPRREYAATLAHLRINEHTRVVYQGFTGHQATANARQSLEWGTKVVGGVTPGKSERCFILLQHTDHPGVRGLIPQAARTLRPDASAIFVPAHSAAAAIEEAIEAEIPLVVAVAEHVPVHDMLHIHSILKTQSRTRLVGANCPGIINPVSRTRIGFLPHPVFSPGSIGIVAKSGTLSYEAVASTTRVGLGQSLVIGMGGDWLAGTSLLDGVKVFLDDPGTEGIIVIGEVGGTAELDVAEFLQSWKGPHKPIMGLMAGLTALKGRAMGHAGAVRGLGEPAAQEKSNILQKAGVTMVTHPGEFGPRMRELFDRKARGTQGTGIMHRTTGVMQGTRSLHTISRRQKSLHHGSPEALLDRFLGDFSVLPIVDEESTDKAATWSIGITVDRSALSPCIFAANATSGRHTKIPFDYRLGPLSTHVQELHKFLEFDRTPDSAAVTITGITHALWQAFTRHEAYTFLLTNVVQTRDGNVVIVPGMDVYLDEATARERHPDQLGLVRQRSFTYDEGDPDGGVARADAARAAGIVYHKLPGAGTIGTLVNGAGLAMNTIDALIKYGGAPANFLDTGGRATKETVRDSLRIVLTDTRVKVVFVNIFGGLTRGTMIAEGIILGFKELGIKLPVVVRIRGTEECEGQEMIRKSGLPLFAYDDLDDAAKKVIELVNEGSREG